MNNAFIRRGNSKDSLGIGSIQSEFISNEHHKIIKILHERDSSIIFAGSVGLIINGLLKRNAIDIDIVTPINYYRGMNEFFWDKRTDPGSITRGFNVGEERIDIFALNFGKIKVDVFYKEETAIDNHKFIEKGFYGKTIRIGDPEEAIRAKLDYIEKNFDAFKAHKHLIDLLEMGIDRNRIIESLKKIPKDIIKKKK
jgi:hypothetical protein